MKRQLLLLTFLFSCLSTFAQRTADATFYSNTGKKFYVVLNGIRQNTEARNNVKISGLTEAYYSCRIIAEDKSFNLEKNIGVKKDTVTTYRIIEKKGKYKLRFYSESSLGTAPAPQDQMNVVYHSSDLPQGNTSVTNTGENVNTNTSTTTTTTNTNQNGTSGENINIDINLTENGMGANVNIQANGLENGTDNDGTVITSTSTETTTTSSSSSTTINGLTTSSSESSSKTSTDNNGVMTHTEESTSIGSEGNVYKDPDMTMTMDSGCGTSEQDMQEITRQMENTAFPDEKLALAKMIASEKCMTVDQIKTISKLFNFDDNKMEFIKAAHNNCMNQADYHQLMEVFAFSDDKEELEKFIRSK